MNVIGACDVWPSEGRRAHAPGGRSAAAAWRPACRHACSPCVAMQANLPVTTLNVLRELARQLANHPSSVADSPPLPAAAPSPLVPAPAPAAASAAPREASTPGGEGGALEETALRIRDMAKQLRAVDDEYEAEMRALQEHALDPATRSPGAEHAGDGGGMSDASEMLQTGAGASPPVHTEAAGRAQGADGTAREARGAASGNAGALSPASQSIQRFRLSCPLPSQAAITCWGSAPAQAAELASPLDMRPDSPPSKRARDQDARDGAEACGRRLVACRECLQARPSWAGRWRRDAGKGAAVVGGSIHGPGG